MDGDTISFLLWCFLAVIIIIGVWWVLTTLLDIAYGELWQKEYAIRNMQPLVDLVKQYLDHQAYGQETTTSKAPPAAVPTQSATPIQIQPNPNFEYLPQKAYVQTYKPEIGIPVGQQPLTAVPQVVPVQPQQQNFISSTVDSLGGIAGVMGMLGAAGVYVKTRFLNKTVKENSAQIVKGADVDATIAKQVFENMPDKGESINDKPEIQLNKLAENKEEATQTAAKA